MTEQPILEVKHLQHIYMKGTPLEHHALSGVSLKINKGECIAVIGHTGSGKSTLIQHVNGLMRPQSGEVVVDGMNLSDPKLDIRLLRRKVGLVFQNPEDQIFEKIIGDDIAYGPFKMGLPIKEVRDRVKWAMEVVGLSFDEMKDRATYALSGGQKRKVALAGVLALRPDILVLDEPTAGLDPRSRNELLEKLKTLNEQEKITIIFVSHNMEEVAYLAGRIYVLADGRNLVEGTPEEVFGEADTLKKHHIGAPDTVEILGQLKAKGFAVRPNAYQLEEAAKEIIAVLRQDGR
ncbi:energy-coupling factor transporter ATPase [Fictibacillus fluitans]|uniref:Energy-coupling factor transporter ATP-binding protein EcfA2 n=1 Tax=Fictibacillus fluitans TaxID=3058422 RepID=A0ABT8HQA2_9BACL|nr:energy-coupling factor transporter ATPase [Fictibacillus sp. NE201]MDN4522945.1 energy-coupling factor transporter ATPase [Fictibacillus sp. NE201]